MNDTPLKTYVEAVRENTSSFNAWFQLGDKAAELEEWRVAVSSFITALKMDPSRDDIHEKIYSVRQSYIEQLNLGSQFKFDLLKLPGKTAYFLLFGVMNMELEPLTQNVYQLYEKGFSNILLDFTGVTYISGLGPSSLRKWKNKAEENQAKLLLINVSEQINSTLQLKKIDIPQVSGILEAFQTET